MTEQNFTAQLATNATSGPLFEQLRAQFYQCQHFQVLVAFVTADILPPLKLWIADCAARGGHGEIIVGTYLNFNDAATLAELQKLPHTTVKVLEQPAVHAKGFIFTHADHVTALVGSANLTPRALLKNLEWGMWVSGTPATPAIAQLTQEFTKWWQQATPLTAAWLEQYHSVPQMPVAQKEQAAASLQPNVMQQNALQQVAALLAQGATRQLVLAATGTGKTLLAAFIARQHGYKRCLFVAHRHELIQQAKATFTRVFGGTERDYAIVETAQDNPAARFVFATVQTLAQPHAQLDVAAFDYVVIDEAHHAVAPSYQRVLAQVTPKLLLGLTATPERPDGKDVYAVFDHNVAYDLSLSKALAASLLTPFHYIGLQDFVVADQVVDDASPLPYLTDQQRVTYILTQLAYYETSAQPARGLVFCRRIAEAKKLAQLFTAAGRAAVALSNADNPKQRARVVQQLKTGVVQYIFAVDLFNEGLDVPDVNQVILLRNTESNIVFTQQIGRGLRKAPHKHSVLILDFIGNYKNNFALPDIALQQRTWTKEQTKATLWHKHHLGLATINFSHIAQQQILATLAHTKIDALFHLKRAALPVMQRLGRPPLLCDLAHLSTLDPRLWAEHSQLAHIGEFWEKLAVPVTVTPEQSAIWRFFTKEIAPGWRLHEAVLLTHLLHHPTTPLSAAAIEQLWRAAGLYVHPTTYASVLRCLNLQFFTAKTAERYANLPVVTQTPAGLVLSERIARQLQVKVTADYDFKDVLSDCVAVAQWCHTHNYSKNVALTRLQRYRRKDVCRLLEWQEDVSAPMYGYRLNNGVCPVFITYHKQQAARSAAFTNTFSSDLTRVWWYSKTPRTLQSAEIQALLQPDVTFHVFVKPDDASGSAFYYLGQATLVPESVQETTVERNGKQKNAVKWQLQLVKRLTKTEFSQVTTQEFG